MTDPVKIIVGEGSITEVNVPEYNLIQTGGGGGGSGSDGATFFPEVSEEGVISWTNDGGYDNPEPVNIKGPAGNDGNDGNDGEDGEDGVSPTVTFTTITGGHTMTVTDKDHPSGQSINIMDGSGGSGTSDYDDLTDKPSINNVTLSGNKTAAQLGLGTYTKPSGGIPASDLASAVQTSLGLADSALQAVPSYYRTVSEQDLIDARLQVGIDRSVKEKEIGIAIISKRPDMAVTAGQYVIITSFSGISGVSNGLYIANTALSPSTDVTAADLTAVNDGGLNHLGACIKNLVLESTGDTTDRTAEIVSRLTTYKKCILGNGTFYTTGIDMPDGSTLIGMGDATVLHKTGSGNYVINMNKNNVVESLCIDGNDTVSSTIGTHHGILWNGDYSTSHDATLQPQNGKLSNLTIKNCNGGGITCNDTGTKRFNNIVACNVAIMNCNTGINIPYYSEYHRFTNFDVFECYYGCINNGGNNCFANCDFSDSKTIGFVIDNSNGDKTNNSHGTCVGCSFNHIANNSGLALSLTGVTAGFTFGNCNIFRGSVEIINSIGVAITDSLFGESLTITVTNSQAIQFANDTFQGAPTLAISGSSYPHFRDCFNYTTGASILNSELVTRTVTITYSASANGTYNANLKTIIDNDLPSGYKCVGITGVQSGNNACMVYAYRYVNSSYALGIKNISSTAVSSVTATIEYLCKPI